MTMCADEPGGSRRAAMLPRRTTPARRQVISYLICALRTYPGGSEVLHYLAQDVIPSILYGPSADAAVDRLRRATR